MTGLLCPNLPHIADIEGTTLDKTSPNETQEISQGPGKRFFQPGNRSANPNVTHVDASPQNSAFLPPASPSLSSGLTRTATAVTRSSIPTKLSTNLTSPPSSIGKLLSGASGKLSVERRCAVQFKGSRQECTVRRSGPFRGN